jgi:hypothetical protein
VNKVGDARVGFVGFPSVGKSTLLTKLTGTYSEVGEWGTCAAYVVEQYQSPDTGDIIHSLGELALRFAEDSQTVCCMCQKQSSLLPCSENMSERIPACDPQLVVVDHSIGSAYQLSCRLPPMSSPP